MPLVKVKPWGESSELDVYLRNKENQTGRRQCRKCRVFKSILDFPADRRYHCFFRDPSTICLSRTCALCHERRKKAGKLKNNKDNLAAYKNRYHSDPVFRASEIARIKLYYVRKRHKAADTQLATSPA